jgi:hypothetical protein
VWKPARVEVGFAEAAEIMLFPVKLAGKCLEWQRFFRSLPHCQK